MYYILYIIYFLTYRYDLYKCRTTEIFYDNTVSILFSFGPFLLVPSPIPSINLDDCHQVKCVSQRVKRETQFCFAPTKIVDSSRILLNIWIVFMLVPTEFLHSIAFSTPKKGAPLGNMRYTARSTGGHVRMGR